jgi:hypothetical protein
MWLVSMFISLSSLVKRPSAMMDKKTKAKIQRNCKFRNVRKKNTQQVPDNPPPSAADFTHSGGEAPLLNEKTDVMDTSHINDLQSCRRRSYDIIPRKKPEQIFDAGRANDLSSSQWYHCNADITA